MTLEKQLYDLLAVNKSQADALWKLAESLLTATDALDEISELTKGYKGDCTELALDALAKIRSDSPTIFLKLLACRERILRRLRAKNEVQTTNKVPIV